MRRLVLPIPPSENRRHGVTPSGRIYVRRSVKQWQRDAGWAAQVWMHEHGWPMVVDTKVWVDVWIWWPSARRADTSNTAKALLDAFNGVVYNDDRWALVRYQDWAIDPEQPRCEVAFSVEEAAHHG